MLACVLFLAGSAVPALAVQRSIVAVGDGTPLGGTVAKIGAFDASASGVVAVRAPLAGGSSSKAILVVSGSGVNSVIAVGDSSPVGGTFSDLGSFALGPAGAVAFRADVAGGAASSGLFLAADGKVEALVLVGDAAPGGGNFIDVRDPQIDGKRAVVFRGTVSFGTSAETSAEEGIFRRLPDGRLETVARAGEESPAGGTFTSFGKPVVNGGGDVIFTANVSGGPKGIFRATGGSLDSVVVQGDEAPGGGVFWAFFLPALADNGMVAFRAGVHQGPSPRAIFLASGGSFTRIVAAGEDSPVPSGSGGGRFIFFGKTPAVDSSGRVAFRAALSGGADGIFVATDGGSIRTIALSGEPAPVGGDHEGLSDPLLAGKGREVFLATLSDPQVSKAVVMDSSGRAPAMRVDCDRGQKLADALAELADGGMVAVSGTCRENVVVSDVGRRIIEGLKVRGKRATLVAADPSLPALDIAPTAGPTALFSLAVRGGQVGLRVAGRGHFLRGDRLQRTALRIDGSGHTVASSRIDRSPGAGMSVGAERSIISHNLVRKAGGAGMIVEGGGSTLTANRLIRNGAEGLKVTGTGNTLTANRAVRNRKGGIVAVAGNSDGGGNRGKGNGGHQVSIP